MANEFSTAGILLKYAAEATPGTRPTAGYTTLPNIKGTPDMNNSPETLEVTDLSDTVWRRYIAGLKDPGDNLEFTANLTAALKTAWAAVVTAAASATVWFEIAIPGGFDSFYFAGIPTELGINAMEVGAVAEISLFIVPNQVHGWDTAST